MKKRLLTPEALTKYVVSADNIKTNKVSYGDLEGLITSTTISGHQMFAGERERPNTLLFMLTLNGPAFSRDMAQRSVIIKVAKPTYSATWWEDTVQFIHDNRELIIGDIAGFFQQEPQQLDCYSRWGAWERDVLARLQHPAGLQDLILERQEAIDSDNEEGDMIEEYFAGQLHKYGYDSDAESVHIPNGIAADWFAAATNENCSTTAMTRRIGQWATEGTMKRLAPHRSNASRGVLWRVPGTNSIAYDLVERITDHKTRYSYQSAGSGDF